MKYTLYHFDAVFVQSSQSGTQCDVTSFALVKRWHLSDFGLQLLKSLHECASVGTLIHVLLYAKDINIYKKPWFAGIILFSFLVIIIIIVIVK